MSKSDLEQKAQWHGLLHDVAQQGSEESLINHLEQAFKQNKALTLFPVL